MSETFNFNGFQIPHTGVEQPDLTASGVARSAAGIEIRREADMKMSNFGALNVDLRNTSDYTKTVVTFKDKDDLADVNVITNDTGIGQNVSLNEVTVNHNPHVWGDSIKFVKDDQFIRMGMGRETGTSSDATFIDQPKFDVMDTNLSTAAGINASTNANMKNWPSEGWRSFGGKYDFDPYAGGVLK